MTPTDEPETVLETGAITVTIHPGPNGPSLKILDSADGVIYLYDEEVTELLESDRVREAFGIDQ